MTDVSPGGSLASSDYDRILDVVAECARAGSWAALRERALESLASVFGYRHATLLLGPTRSGLFQDTGALTLGRVGRMVPAYIEHYHRWDPLAQLAEHRRGAAAGCTLLLNQTRACLTDENRRFLDEHLYRGGFHAVLCTERAEDAAHIGLALFHEQETAFGPRDVAVLQRLGRLLARQAELLTRLPLPPAWALQLTARESEVARLVAHGCTNQEIAAQCHITVDTVKKHVKAACAKAGVANRAGLAAKIAALNAPWTR